MDVIASGMSIAGDVFSGFWSFATAEGHEVLMIGLAISLVSAGVGLFFSLKKRLVGRRRK